MKSLRINDLSKGTENVCISLVDETGKGELPNFVYIPQNTVYKSAYIQALLARISDEDCCATCTGDCLSSLPCECARETRGEFAYTSEGLLKEDFLANCISMYEEPEKHYHFYCKDCPLERVKKISRRRKCKGHLVGKFVKECWRKCGCSMQCGNRVVQRGITRKLQVFMAAEGKGWGIRTLEELPKGAFVCEYVGEILTNTELHERNKKSKNKARHTYPVLLDADWGSESVLKDENALCLDATYYGNIGRFVNHRCCDANLIEIPVEVESPDHHYYHLAFFTKRKVEAFEELTWDYGIDFDDHSHPIVAFKCCCGSAYCRDVNRTEKMRLKNTSSANCSTSMKPIDEALKSINNQSNEAAEVMKPVTSQVSETQIILATDSQGKRKSARIREKMARNNEAEDAADNEVEHVKKEEPKQNMVRESVAKSTRKKKMAERDRDIEGGKGSSDDNAEFGKSIEEVECERSSYKSIMAKKRNLRNENINLEGGGKGKGDELMRKNNKGNVDGSYEKSKEAEEKEEDGKLDEVEEESVDEPRRKNDEGNVDGSYEKTKEVEEEEEDGKLGKVKEESVDEDSNLEMRNRMSEQADPVAEENGSKGKKILEKGVGNVGAGSEELVLSKFKENKKLEMQALDLGQNSENVVINGDSRGKKREAEGGEDQVEKMKKSREGKQYVTLKAEDGSLYTKDYKTSCSPGSIYKLVMKLTNAQKDDVKAIGFGGLLHLKISKLPLKIVPYLVQNFHDGFFVQYVGNDKYSLSSNDVHDVFGLPISSNEVLEVSHTGTREKRDLELREKWKSKFGIEGQADIPLDLVLEELLKLKDGGEEFKRLFVIYCLGNFLAPNVRKHVDMKLLRSVEDVETIKESDWCGFVLKKLCEGVRRFKKAPSYNCVSGCVFFLLIQYLQRVPYRGSKDPTELPLIQHWDDEKMKDRCSWLKSAGYDDAILLKNVYPLSYFGQLQPTINVWPGAFGASSSAPERFVGISPDNDIRALGKNAAEEAFIFFRRDMELATNKLSERLMKAQQKQVDEGNSESLPSNKHVLAFPTTQKIIDDVVRDLKRGAVEAMPNLDLTFDESG